MALPQQSLLQDSLLHESLPHEDAIFERLEATRRHGLVSDYLMSFVGGPSGYQARVTVWPNDASTEDVVKAYIARLLHGLVADREIVVAQN